VVVASHAIEPFVELADRVLVLHAGHLAAEGPPQAVLVDPILLRGAGLQPYPLAEAAFLLRSRGRAAPDWRTPSAFADSLLEVGRL
jgi:energy-coupling factor transporter ATP-binding protein EcfA2